MSRFPPGLFSFQDMRPSLKIALLFAGIWFLGKLVFFYTQTFQEPEGFKFLVMWNILCLLSGMTLGIYTEIRNEDRSQSTALNDIRKAMGGGMIYAVTVSVLMYMYYSKIDPGYNENQIAMSIERDKAFLANPKNLEKLKEDPEYNSISKEEIIEKRVLAAKQVFSAGTTMTMALLGMLMLVTINAIILTVVFRRLLFRQRTI
jgi:hypothetical protein